MVRLAILHYFIRMSTTQKSLFGEILLEIRKAKNITQYRLSKLTGLSERHLNYIERGVREPRLITLIRLADALEMSPGELVNAFAVRLRQEERSVPQLKKTLSP